MSISTPYQSAIRRRAVVDFIRDNRRSPTEAELRELLRLQYEKYSAVDDIGFAGYELNRPGFSATSSAATENTNRKALADDQRVLRERLEELALLQEEAFRGFFATAARNARSLDQLEKRVDTLLLINGNSDVFVNGIEEAFQTHEHVDYELTDASVEDGYTTIGRTGYGIIDLAEVKLKYAVVAPKGILSKRNTSDINSLKSDDGTFWEYLVYTDYEHGRVSLVIEVEFNEASFVGDVKLGLSPSSVNKKMTASLFYSIDGTEFTATDPLEVTVESDSLVFNVGIEGVKKVQVVFSKDAYDTKTPNRKQCIYSFSLDSLKIYSDLFEEGSSSVLICGPYDLLDSSGSPIYYTKAALSACTYEPDETSVDFYVSNDGETWKFSSHDEKSIQLVTFGDASVGSSVSYIDATASPYAVLAECSDVDEVDFQTEGILNAYISAEYYKQIPLQSIVLTRNIVDGDPGTKILQAERGWYLDEVTKRYTTTIYVDAPEGRTINFGPKAVGVNGTLMSGQVFFQQGYSVVSVSDTSWRTVTDDLTSVSALKAADPLYPYNHKLLLSGYNYPTDFSGEKVYTGVDDYFSRKLNYMAPDLFAFLEPGDLNYYNVFTIEELDGTVYFKVKVNKQDGTWSQEKFGFDWTVQNSESNQLWVKALLRSSAAGKTPADRIVQSPSDLKERQSWRINSLVKLGLSTSGLARMLGCCAPRVSGQLLLPMLKQT